MRCPACKQPMIVVEHQGIELDHCLACKGTWFDSGELELLLGEFSGDAGTLFPQPLESLPDASTSEKRRRCPRCRKKMKKTHLGGANPVLVDVCKLGDGIWFDAGEVSQFILRTLETLPGAQGKTLTFLGETFRASTVKGGVE